MGTSFTRAGFGRGAWGRTRDRDHSTHTHPVHRPEACGIEQHHVQRPLLIASAVRRRQPVARAAKGQRHASATGRSTGPSRVSRGMFPDALAGARALAAVPVSQQHRQFAWPRVEAERVLDRLPGCRA